MSQENKANKPSKYDSLLRYGVPGLIGTVLLLSLPYLIDLWRVSREQDRKDLTLSDNVLERHIGRLETQLDQCSEEVVFMNAQIAVAAERRKIERAAWDDAEAAMWTLVLRGNDLRLEACNDAFANWVLAPGGVTAEMANGKTWYDIFPQTQAAMYDREDRQVVNLRSTFYSDETYSYNLDGTKNFWVVMKWPLIVESKLVGLQGIAVPLKNTVR